MAFATATVESWIDNPCASWVEGGVQGDVKKSLSCDASEQQLWLVFFVILTVYSVRSRIFGTLTNGLVSVLAEITFQIWWTLFYCRLKLEKAWNELTNFIIICLILLDHTGTYENSYFLGREEIFETCNPAFGGRGPGFQRRLTGTNSQLDFDSTRGFPGEGWVQ